MAGADGLVTTGPSRWDRRVTVALAYRKRRLRLVRSAVLLAVLGGITVVVAGSHLTGVGAVLAGTGGLAALLGGVVAARRLLATLRYRVGGRRSLLQVDATGLRLGRAGMPWTAVAQVDLAAAGPDRVEVGVRLVAGQVVSGVPTQGTVLADLPVCVVVPALDVERLRRAVREFGDPAIPVMVRA
jgi:hypothetical protein